MAEDRFEERGRRAFAVRAGDMDAGIGAVGAAEALRKDSNVLKVELCGGDLCRRSQFPAEGEQIADRCLAAQTPPGITIWGQFRFHDITSSQLKSRSRELLMYDFKSLRWTTASRKPCSRRNSER